MVLSGVGGADEFSPRVLGERNSFSHLVPSSVKFMKHGAIIFIMFECSCDCRIMR